MSRLQSQSDAFVGSGDVTWTLGYNPASQITSDARSNSSYSWTGAVTVNRGYAVNGLNQYTGAGSANFTYDANGNLTGDGTWVYTYDGENHLIHATGSGKDVTLSYDPLGRLWSVGGSNIADVNFLYDGDALVGEYSSSNGNMANRYVHGSNAAADDPLVRYIGSAVGSSNRRYFHADHEGSIVAQSDGTGTNVAINTYDEYGIPGSGNDSRFGYTGQAYFYEIGLDYYKARMYSPTLGRFLQTDPIGYDGGENLYAYVGDDPVDEADPSGHGDPNNEANCPQTSIDPGAGPCTFGNQDNGPDVGPSFDGVQVAQVEPPEENARRGGLLDTDPTAEIRSESFNSSVGQIIKSEPDNPKTSFITSPDYVPTWDQVAEMRQEAQSAGQRQRLAREIIQNGGKAPPGFRGGAQYKNDGRGGTTVLPRVPNVTFRRYDVYPSGGGVPRGPERLVIDSTGRVYYTPDHYFRFWRIYP